MRDTRLSKTDNGDFPEDDCPRKFGQFQPGDKDVSMSDNQLSIIDYCLSEVLADVPLVEDQGVWLNSIVSEALDRLLIFDNRFSNTAELSGLGVTDDD